MHKNLIPLALLGTLAKAGFLPLQERATASTISRAVLAAAPPGEASQTSSPADSQIPGIQDSSAVSLYDRAKYGGQVPFNDFPEDVERPPKQCALCEAMGHDPQITSTTAIYGRPSNGPPMPKLSTTTSPTGSSCVSTATVTTCRYVGVGHGSVCVENPTCLSWVPINSPPLDTGCIAHEDCANHCSLFFCKTWYDVPADMPECPEKGCYCAWLWIPDSCGQPNMYMQNHRCKVTGSTSTNNLGTPNPPAWCRHEPSKCVAGPKQMMAWNQLEGNNVDAPQSKTPTYNQNIGFFDGAQDDILLTSKP